MFSLTEFLSSGVVSRDRDWTFVIQLLIIESLMCTTGPGTNVTLLCLCLMYSGVHHLAKFPFALVGQIH